MQGKENLITDALLRTIIAGVHLGIDYHHMAMAKQQDAEVQAYRTATSALQVHNLPLGTKGNMLLCDISTGNARPLVPLNWRPTLKITSKLLL